MAPSAAIFLHHCYNPLKTNYAFSCIEYTNTNAENKTIETNFMKMKKETERVEFGSKERCYFFVKTEQMLICWNDAHDEEYNDGLFSICLLSMLSMRMMTTRSVLFLSCGSGEGRRTSNIQCFVDADCKVLRDFAI